MRFNLHCTVSLYAIFAENARALDLKTAGKPISNSPAQVVQTLPGDPNTLSQTSDIYELSPKEVGAAIASFGLSALGGSYAGFQYQSKKEKTETEVSIEKAKGDKHELKPVEEALESSIKVQDTQIKNLEEEIKKYEDGIDRLNRKE